MKCLPGQLWAVGASVEECGRSVGEPLLWQQVVSLDDSVNVSLMNPNCHPHEHVLGSLGNYTETEQVSMRDGAHLNHIKKTALKICVFGQVPLVRSPNPVQHRFVSWQDVNSYRDRIYVTGSPFPLIFRRYDRSSVYVEKHKKVFTFLPLQNLLLNYYGL